MIRSFRFRGRLLLLIGLILSAQPMGAAPRVFDLVEITDFHGYLVDLYNNPVAGVLAQNLKDIRRGNPDRTIILSGGDNYQGTAMSNVLYGKPVMQVFNEVGVDVTTIGNHEFDWGLDTALANPLIGYPQICANLYDKRTGLRVKPAYQMIERDGIKFAIIGGITQTTQYMELPIRVADYQFTDLITELNAAAVTARAAGAHVVVALVHEGDDYNSGVTGPIFDVAAGLVGIDVVLAGHSHDIVNTTSALGKPLVIANCYGKGLIAMQLTIDTGPILSDTHWYRALNTSDTFGYYAPSPIVDGPVAAIVSAAQAEVAPIFGTVVGQAAVPMSRTMQVLPFGESLMGNWVCDVIRDATGAPVGVFNNGGLRYDFAAGPVTVGMLYNLLPFDNTICTAILTPAQIRALFEEALGVNPATGFGARGTQVSGLKVTYDPYRPFGSKVTSITWADGSSFSLTDTVTRIVVATNDFMATGGDGFSIFLDTPVKSSMINTQLLVRDKLSERLAHASPIAVWYEHRLANASAWPIAVDAGSDTVAKRGDTVPLRVHVTHGADSGPLTYAWTQLSGPTAAGIASPADSVTAFIPRGGGQYILAITVTGDSVLAASDTVRVLVGDSWFVAAAGTSSLTLTGALAGETSSAGVTLSGGTPVGISFQPHAGAWTTSLAIGLATGHESSSLMIFNLIPDSYRIGLGTFEHYDDFSPTLCQFTVLDTAGLELGPHAASFGSLSLTFTVNTGSLTDDEKRRLRVFTFNESDSTWKLVSASRVAFLGNTADISTALEHLSIFAVGVAGAIPYTAGQVVVYPNPFIPNDQDAANGVPWTAGDATSGIIFDNLPTQSTICIYTLNGRLVQKITTVNLNTFRWDGKSENGRDVASGVYVYTLSSNAGSARGKIMVIR